MAIPAAANGHKVPRSVFEQNQSFGDKLVKKMKLCDSQEKKPDLNDLPEDVLQDILKNLDGNTLLQIAPLVNTRWRVLVNGIVPKWVINLRSGFVRLNDQIDKGNVAKLEAVERSVENLETTSNVAFGVACVALLLSPPIMAVTQTIYKDLDTALKNGYEHSIAQVMAENPGFGRAEAEAYLQRQAYARSQALHPNFVWPFRYPSGL
jgi:hypothetical protein